MDFPKIELKILEKLKMSKDGQRRGFGFMPLPTPTHHICLVNGKGMIESTITLGKDAELDKYVMPKPHIRGTRMFIGTKGDATDCGLNLNLPYLYASESDMKMNHIRNRLRAKLEKRKKN